MYDSESREAVLGHSAEEAITRWFTERRIHVVPTHAFTHDAAHTPAPMMRGPDGALLVLPDLLCFPPDGSPFWTEVKARRFPGWHRVEARWEHGIGLQRVRDYSEVERVSGLPVRVALLEVHSPVDDDFGGLPVRDHCRPSGLWLVADLKEIMAAGARRYDWPEAGEAGWLWPRSAMHVRHVDPPLAAIPDDIRAAAPSRVRALPSWLEGEPRHSVLVTDPDLPLSDIETLLHRGIKVHWFVRQAPALDRLRVFTVFKAGLLNLHPLPEESVHLVVVDGRGSPGQLARLTALGRIRPTTEGLIGFNAEQFRVEHAPIDEHLQVRAGAGTGKTRVMIQRVLFLLGVIDGLEPSEIALITFTRDATRVMKDRLVDAISIRFRLTGQDRFLRWLLALPGMQISTIPSFGRHLLTRAGTALGISPDFQIRQFTLERRQVIRDVLNELLREGLASADVRALLGRPLHEFERTAARFWEQLENRGLDLERIQKIDWGRGAGEQSEFINGIWARLFSVGERRLTALKELENAVSISDLTRLLRQLGAGLSELARQQATWRYLFVDEFQDTDEVQIDLVDSLAAVLQARVFVVGDVKQSIYRFRGADYTAFEQLQRRFNTRGVSLTSYPLQKNYRTSQDIMESLEPCFLSWGERRLLPYGSSDRLFAEVDAPGAVELIPCGRDDRDDAMLTAIHRGLELGGGRAWVLVRTNHEAGRVQSVCQTHDIRCLIDRSGGFYQSPAVREFRVLVQALLHPDEPIHQLNLMHSSYSAQRLPWTRLWRCQGHRGRLMAALDTWQPHPDWRQLLEDCRLKPIPAVLREAIRKMRPTRRYHDRLLVTDPTNALDLSRRYHGNLNKLMSLLHDLFNEEFITLGSLEQWLAIRMATDSEENEAERPDLGERAGVVCMTVHRAKGLEFPTVVLPLTDRSFHSRGAQLVVDEAATGRFRVGWLLPPDQRAENGNTPEPLRNNLHGLLYQGDRREGTREETRLRAHSGFGGSLSVETQWCDMT